VPLSLISAFAFAFDPRLTLVFSRVDFGTPSKTSIFGVRSSPSNYVKPGKKPLSSMSPVMLFRRQEGAKVGEWGDLHMVVGGSGGPKIITAVLQVILNYVHRGMPLFESVAHARVHDQLLYRDALVTAVEQSKLLQGPTISVSNKTRAALDGRGHKLLELDYLGTVQAVAVDPETGELSAVSDIRKGGSPAGY
jgi:gamma-glutamyltranspeptidase